MEQRTFRDEHAAAFNRLVVRTPKMPRSIHSFSVNVYFGEAEDECFADFARRQIGERALPICRTQMQ